MEKKFSRYIEPRAESPSEGSEEWKEDRRRYMEWLHWIQGVAKDFYSKMDEMGLTAHEKSWVISGLDNLNSGLEEQVRKALQIRSNIRQESFNKCNGRNSFPKSFFPQAFTPLGNFFKQFFTGRGKGKV